MKFQDLALAVRRLERGYMRFILVVAEHGEEADISEFVDHAEKSIRDLQNAYITCRVNFSFHWVFGIFFFLY